MFDKLFEAKQKAEEVKSRLDQVSVSSEVEGGKIKVISTANKEIKEIFIDPEFFNNVEKEELEELLIVVLNKVLSQAESINQVEMQAVSQQMLGGLGNMFGNK